MPGLSYLAAGFDALKMVSVDEISPSDQSKFRLFDLSESDGQIYTLSTGSQEQDFNVPSLVQVTDISMASIVAVESISKSFNQFISLHYSSYSFGLNAIIPIPIASIFLPITLDFGFDTITREAYQLMQSKYTAVSTSTTWWGMYSIQMAPGYLMKFSSVFNKSLSKLVVNPTTERQQSYYNEIVATFGTHYVPSVIVGGVAYYYTFINEEWQRMNSQSATENEISIGFHLGFDIPLGDFASIGIGEQFGGISFGHNWGDSSSTQSESFKKDSESKVYFRPSPLGLSSSPNNYNWTAWVVLAAKQPAVVNRTLFPLSNLLLEYPIDIAEHLQRTIDFYLSYGKLPKLANVSRTGKFAMDSMTSIPGLEVVGCGYNIIELRSSQCLFDITYNDNKIWSNIFSGHKSYRIPDRYSIKGTQELYSTYNTQIFNSYDKFMENYVYINQEEWANVFSFDTSYERSDIVRLFQNMYKHRLNLAWTERRVFWYNLSIDNFPTPPLNSAAETAFNSLPVVFNEEDFSTIWKSFFDIYGTHYVVSADFGGMVWAEDYFDPCLLTTYSSQWIKNQIKRSYWYISTSEFNSLYTPVANQSYLNHRISIMGIIGGREKWMSIQLKEWMQTIKDRPHAITYKLVPLYTILPLDSQKRKSLEEATLYIWSKAVNATNSYMNNLQSAPWPLPTSPLDCSASVDGVIT